MPITIPPSNANKDRTTRRNGLTQLVEEHQEIKDSLDGRKYLEKLLLLCPPGEPPTHSSLSTCLHQISAMPSIPKTTINAIRAVAFLLEEIEDSQINETLRQALDSQMTEFTTDMRTLIEDAKEKIDDHIKISTERINSIQAPPPPTPTVQATQQTNTYASMLINPPAHANPRVAAREGIKARQFLIEGIKNSKFSHLDIAHLKTEINTMLSDSGLPTGRIRTIVNSRNGGTIIEADTDSTAAWLSVKTNQRKICDLIGSNAEFRTRAYNIIAFNVPLAINIEDINHRIEINEANDLDPTTITAARWIKAIERRSPEQKTAHLMLTLSNADAANRAIANGLIICNRRCRIERSKREPTRCLKCQGWNHFATDCNEEKDRCGNCAEQHRTISCLTSKKNCVSCNTNDHPSWSRSCPTFLRKLDEFNVRNPDNSLQFFPTADAWTWTATERTLTSLNPNSSQPRQNNAPQNRNTQQPRRINDSYVPQRKNDTYIPRRQNDSYVPARQSNPASDTYIPQYDSSGWGDNSGPSQTRPPTGSQLTQRTNGNNSNPIRNNQSTQNTQNTSRPENPPQTSNNA